LALAVSLAEAAVAFSSWTLALDFLFPFSCLVMTSWEKVESFGGKKEKKKRKEEEEFSSSSRRRKR